ncbi:MAG: hypothetical protein R3C45_15615 [Phycisphaerales bacterium]
MKCNATVIGDGCKIDNLVQIRHNRLRKMVVISGCTDVGSSTVIGDGTMIGRHVAIADHVVIGSGVRLAGAWSAGDPVTLPDGVTYAGSAPAFREALKGSPGPDPPAGPFGKKLRRAVRMPPVEPSLPSHDPGPGSTSGSKEP